MTKLLHVLAACLAMVMVNTKPSQTTKADVTKELESLASAHGQMTDAEQSPRQKRWYNFNDFPSASSQEGDSFDRQENTVLEIYRKLKDISSIVRNPIQQAPQQLIPVYIPVLFIPMPCNCGGQNSAVDITTQSPITNDTTPNWGIMGNDTNGEEDDTINRPISFKPIQPDEPSNRPPPPVERESAQEGVNAPTQQTGRVKRAATTSARVPKDADGNMKPASYITPDSVQSPSKCDMAVLSCCHQQMISAKCFAALDCDLSKTEWNNACSKSNILNAVNKFQMYYTESVPIPTLRI